MYIFASKYWRYEFQSEAKFFFTLVKYTILKHILAMLSIKIKSLQKVKMQFLTNEVFQSSHLIMLFSIDIVHLPNLIHTPVGLKITCDQLSIVDNWIGQSYWKTGKNIGVFQLTLGECQPYSAMRKSLHKLGALKSLSDF